MQILSYKFDSHVDILSRCVFSWWTHHALAAIKSRYWRLDVQAGSVAVIV